MPAVLPPESTAILDDLRRIVRALRESSRAAEQALGVTGAQLFVLRSLAFAQPLSLNMLAARTRTHQSTVSVVVSRLVRAGLVSRTTSESDARSRQLRLTKRGERLLERAPLAAQDRLIAGVERLPSAQRKQLARALNGLVKAMQLGDEPPEMFFEADAQRAPRSRRGRA